MMKLRELQSILGRLNNLHTRNALQSTAIKNQKKLQSIVYVWLEWAVVEVTHIFLTETPQ